MRLVVLGAGGLLGSNVVATASASGHDVVGTYHTAEPELPASFRQLDITEVPAFREFLRAESPDAVVNCAAMTDVDGCEDDSGQAFAVNGTAPASIATVCDGEGVDVLHVSTDYVFDGRAEGRYDEDAPTNPLQVYGRSKLVGERGVRDAARDPLLVRLSFVWGVHRGRDELTGFPRWVRDSLRDGDEVPLFTDQRVTPTRAGQAATVMVALLEREVRGTFNVASRSCVSPFEFGHALASRMSDCHGSVARSSMADVDRPARRPAETCLSVERVEEQLGRDQPTLEADIAAVEGYI